MTRRSLSIAVVAATAATAVALATYRRRRKRAPARPPPAPAKTELARLAEQIRGRITSLDDARAFARAASRARWGGGAFRPPPGRDPGARPLGLAIYPGSFNPPSRVHIELVRRVCELEGVDAVWLDMTVHVAKKLYIREVASDRVRMAEVAVAHLPRAGVTQLMAEMGEKGWGPEYFEALRALAEGAAVGGGGGGGGGGGRDVAITWVMGSDVVVGMTWWAEKARELLRHCAQLIVFQRQHSAEEVIAAFEGVMRRPRAELEASGLRIVVMNTGDPTLEITSSSAIRRYLVSLLKLVPLSVLRYIVNNDHLIEFYVSLYNEIDVRAAIQEARPALRRIHSGSQLKRPPSGDNIAGL